jgi:hypothetical protein
MLISQQNRSSGYYRVIETVVVKLWTNNGKYAATIQPRPAPLSQVYLFFLHACF